MKFVQARNYQKGRRKFIRLLVVHDMEAPEKSTTAEAVANYFASPNARIASAHYCIDNDSEVQCVKDSDTAYAAKGANADGLHFELTGYARQTPADWDDEFSRKVLKRSANLMRTKAQEYDIPLVHLNVAQVQDGKTKGITDHATITKAFPPGTGHTDPGPSFPWSVFMGLVRGSDSPAWSVSPGKSVTDRIKDSNMYFRLVIADTLPKGQLWLIDLTKKNRAVPLEATAGALIPKAEYDALPKITRAQLKPYQ